MCTFFPTFHEQHDKLHGLETERQAIQDFLDYLESEKLHICEWATYKSIFGKKADREELTFTTRKKDELIAGCLGIDIEAFYAEKELIYKWIVWNNGLSQEADNEMAM